MLSKNKQYVRVIVSYCLKISSYLLLLGRDPPKVGVCMILGFSLGKNAHSTRKTLAVRLSSSTLYEVSHSRRNLRSTIAACFSCHKTKRTTVVGHLHAIASLTLWNSPPKEMRDMDRLDACRRHLKTFYSGRHLLGAILRHIFLGRHLLFCCHLLGLEMGLRSLWISYVIIAHWYMLLL